MFSQLFRTTRKLPVFALAAMLAVSAAACDDNPNEPSDGNQTINGNISSSTAFNIHSITAGRAGNMTAVLTFPTASVDLDLYFTNTSCVDDVFLTAGCVVFDSSQGITQTETVSGTVTDGQQFRLIVENFAQLGTTSYVLQITIN